MKTKPPASQTNLKHWDEVAELNASSDYYDLSCFENGGDSLSSVERSELPILTGLRGVHLQCGNGLETISLTRRGAEMIGVDFSTKTALRARENAQRVGEQVEFVVADVLDPGLLDGQQFDFVYSSHGVLRWLPDLAPWGRNVFRLLKPGGFLYLFEIHPLVFRLQRIIDVDAAVLQGDYFHEKPVLKRITQTHIGNLPEGQETLVAHTDWTIGTIVSTLVGEGLNLEFFHEHHGTSYSRKGLFSKRRGGLWHPPNECFPIPVAFSLIVRRIP